MKRLVLSLLAFLAGPALVLLTSWGSMLLQFGDALFTVPGGIIVRLGRGVGWFAQRNCSTSSKPRVCDLENAINEIFLRPTTGIFFWLILATLASAYWAWRVWRRSSRHATRPAKQASRAASR